MFHGPFAEGASVRAAFYAVCARKKIEIFMGVCPSQGREEARLPRTLGPRRKKVLKGSWPGDRRRDGLLGTEGNTPGERVIKVRSEG